MNEEEIKKAQEDVNTLWVEMKKALEKEAEERKTLGASRGCLLYTSPSPRD